MKTTPVFHNYEIVNHMTVTKISIWNHFPEFLSTWNSSDVIPHNRAYCQSKYEPHHYWVTIRMKLFKFAFWLTLNVRVVIHSVRLTHCKTLLADRSIPFKSVCANLTWSVPQATQRSFWAENMCRASRDILKTDVISDNILHMRQIL